MINSIETKQALIALYTLMSKEVLRFTRIWTQTLIPPAITMSLYFIIFGHFIGSQLNLIHNFTYIQYITPGLIMMSVMTNAYSNTASSFFLIKFNKSIEEMLVSPMPNFVILTGFLLGGTIRGIAVGLIVLVISRLFTHFPLLHPFIALSMLLLASMVFSLGGIINGIYAKRFDDIAFIPTFVLTPLTYLGGVFYSIQQLPAEWRTVAGYNPILNIVDTFRYGLLGISDTSVVMSFILISLLFVVLFIWAWRLLINGTGTKT